MRFLTTLLLVLALAVGVPAAAQVTSGDPDETTEQMLDRWSAEAELIEQLIANEAIKGSEIDAARATLEQQRAEIKPVIDSAEADLAPLQEQLAALGEPPAEGEEEAQAVAEERAHLNDQITVIDTELKKAKQADARTAALLDQVAGLRREAFTRALMTRSASIANPGTLGLAGESIGELLGKLRDETAHRIAARPGDGSILIRILIPLGLLTTALFFVVGLKRVALQRLLRPVKHAPHKRRVAAAIGVTLVRLVIPALALFMVMVAAWNSGLLGPHGNILLRGIAGTLIVVIWAYALGGAYYAPHAPELRISSLSEKESSAAHSWLMALAAVLGLDRVLVVQGRELDLSIEALAVFNTILIAAGAVLVWGISRYLAPASTDKTDHPVYGPIDDEDAPVPEAPPATIGPTLTRAAIIIARILAGLAVVLALAGYFDAARHAFYPPVFSGLVIGVCVLLFYVVRDTVDELVGPVDGAEAEDAPSRIRLIPIFVAFLLICAAIPVLALVWGADGTDLAMVWHTVSEGFAIGEVTISPIDFFTFLLIFAIGYVVTRIVQGVLSRSVLPVTRLDAGVKAAINAGIGYIGIILAALVAISATGLDLSNLAIVAGALSVGIGFGLQNVVNNFVSGIILLIERPIQNGDWVEINGIHGTVQKVNVRSTEIQTFDRATMFVPNADLIANTVTNWTHGNSLGRLIVKVGVAYGTDTRRVEEILLEIAKEHPGLMRRPEPFILFMGFGADSLDFEIRGVLRDVLTVFRVTSEINHQIAARFAEEEIEIPFAQRDLHIRNVEALGQAIGDAVRAAPAEPGNQPDGKKDQDADPSPGEHDA